MSKVGGDNLSSDEEISEVPVSFPDNGADPPVLDSLQTAVSDKSSPALEIAGEKRSEETMSKIEKRPRLEETDLLESDDMNLSTKEKADSVADPPVLDSLMTTVSDNSSTALEVAVEKRSEEIISKIEKRSKLEETDLLESDGMSLSTKEEAEHSSPIKSPKNSNNSNVEVKQAEQEPLQISEVKDLSSKQNLEPSSKADSTIIDTNPMLNLLLSTKSVCKPKGVVSLKTSCSGVQSADCSETSNVQSGSTESTAIKDTVVFKMPVVLQRVKTFTEVYAQFLYDQRKPMLDIIIADYLNSLESVELDSPPESSVILEDPVIKIILSQIISVTVESVLKTSPSQKHSKETIPPNIICLDNQTLNYDSPFIDFLKQGNFEQEPGTSSSSEATAAAEISELKNIGEELCKLESNSSEKADTASPSSLPTQSSFNNPVGRSVDTESLPYKDSVNKIHSKAFIHRNDMLKKLECVVKKYGGEMLKLSSEVEIEDEQLRNLIIKFSEVFKLFREAVHKMITKIKNMGFVPNISSSDLGLAVGTLLSALNDVEKVWLESYYFQYETPNPIVCIREYIYRHYYHCCSYFVYLSNEISLYLIKISKENPAPVTEKK